jgi:hypothetical protein
MARCVRIASSTTFSGMYRWTRLNLYPIYRTTTPRAWETSPSPLSIEETAIKGFTVLADLAGEYPDNLGGKTFFKELEALFAPMRDRGRSEKYTKLADISMPIGGLLSFYQILVQGKKDPAYHGEFVTPEDADLVLMRWKVSDNEYRVIFGDRHAETVTAEVLKELEEELPKLQ